MEWHGGLSCHLILDRMAERNDLGGPEPSGDLPSSQSIAPLPCGPVDGCRRTWNDCARMATNGWGIGKDIAWREQAACLRYPGIMFFGHDESESTAERRARENEAKQICFGCPVRQQCLEYALSTREPYGIWGGLTEIERRSRLHGRVG